MSEPYDDYRAMTQALAEAVDLPACPPWCALPAGHPWDSVPACDDYSPCRTHERSFGAVDVAQTETGAAAGPVLDAAVILTHDPGRDLSAVAAAELGRDLIAAAEFARTLPAVGATPAGSR